MKASVLIVDDDAGLRRALADRMRFWGHAVTAAADGAEALEAVRTKGFDLILLDLNMPGISGLDLLRQLGSDGSEADRVVLTAHGSVEKAVEAMKLGAVEFLLKPADFDLLKGIVDRALERRRLVRVNAALEQDSAERGGLVEGPSPAMHRLMETARRAAASDALILITGESGSGKQVLAEAIHRESARARGPFVHVNCVAISDELIESTLFGHEKGAFTGAVARKPGKLETAAGGTAFLDEVGDISPKLQTKLLHFLESGEFERVGGTRTQSADCRLIAATNRDLEQAKEEGHFREDLYFRLNVINLRIPPLRERPEDIPVLARAFVERFAGELKRGPLELAPETLQVMAAYPWPGNVRQLRNAVERMAVLATTPRLTLELLPPEISDPPAGGGGVPEPASGASLKEAMRAFKKRTIEEALAATGGNKTKAADRLGLQRTHLSKLVRELGIDG